MWWCDEAIYSAVDRSIDGCRLEARWSNKHRRSLSWKNRDSIDSTSGSTLLLFSVLFYFLYSMRRRTRTRRNTRHRSIYVCESFAAFCLSLVVLVLVLFSQFQATLRGPSTDVYLFDIPPTPTSSKITLPLGCVASSALVTTTSTSALPSLEAQDYGSSRTLVVVESLFSFGLAMPPGTDTLAGVVEIYVSGRD